MAWHVFFSSFFSWGEWQRVRAPSLWFTAWIPTAALKPGAWNSIQSSISVSGRNPNHLSHHCCCPGSSLAGTWSQELQLGIKPRAPTHSMGHRSLKWCQLFSQMPTPGIALITLQSFSIHLPKPLLPLISARESTPMDTPGKLYNWDDSCIPVNIKARLFAFEEAVLIQEGRWD